MEVARKWPQVEWKDVEPRGRELESHVSKLCVTSKRRMCVVVVAKVC